MRSIKDYGVKGDSYQDDYPYFQAALDSDEEELYVPAGKYRIHGMLVMKSNTKLILHPEAYIILDSYTGSEQYPFLLTAQADSTNITVDGGIWEGNCAENFRRTDEHPYRGILISFTDVSGLVLRNMTVRDSEAFHIRLNFVTDFTIEDILFEDTRPGYTQDGIHIGGGCERGVVRRIRAVGPTSTNDDLIALISDLSEENMADYDPIWGQRVGPIRDIEISEVSADNTFSFMRICSGNELIENIYAHHFSGGCHFIGLQMEISPYMRGQYDKYPPETVYGAGHIRNITIEDWNIYTRLFYGNNSRNYFESYVNGLIDLEESVENLVIRRFHRDYERDAKGNLLPTLMINNFKTNKVAFSEDASPELLKVGYTPYKMDGSIEYLSITTLKEE